jgi:hypothetical protein
MAVNYALRFLEKSVPKTRSCLKDMPKTLFRKSVYLSNKNKN